MPDDKVSTQLLESIDHQGCLVMDREKTTNLLIWIDEAEKRLEQYQTLISNMRKIVEPLK